MGNLKGKFKHSSGQRCPDCNEVLQVRTVSTKSLYKGQETDVSEDIIVCPGKGCNYEQKMDKKRKYRVEEVSV